MAGKTVWAKHVTDNPEEILYVNCAGCPEPDLRLLRPHHKGVLFDEASPSMIFRQKLLIQAPPDWILLGCSTTNCHSYQVYVSGLMFIICSNKWTSDVQAFKNEEDKEWLEANSTLLVVGDEKMYH